MAFKIKKAILYLFLLILGATCLLPFLLMMVNATRSGNEISTYFRFIPAIPPTRAINR